jgi:uncharacterized protein (DUF2235 family)
MPKTIVYCADGTWNGPGVADEKDADPPKVTNVYRLFDLLQGDIVETPDGGIGLTRIQKEFTAPDGTRQLSMYCHGVGSNHLLPYMQAVGGAFGGGLTTRIRLGYSFISHNFEKDDRIVIVGFSRGAYTARALADMIATQGLLRPEQAKEHGPISEAASAWLLYRSSVARDKPTHVHFWEESMKWHRLALIAAGRNVTISDLVDAKKVAAVGVWDTVGAMGIPRYDRSDADRVDEYGFDGVDLSANIANAFHAVSIDEQRRDFTPTLWKPDERVRQELFAGGHSDVGGGYTDLDEEGKPVPPSRA